MKNKYNHIIKKTVIFFIISLSLTSCDGTNDNVTANLNDGSNNGSNDDSNNNTDRTAPIYDFSTLDSELEAFTSGIDAINGVSYIVVDKNGVIHKSTHGNHTEDTAVAVASLSKVASAMTLLALDGDDRYDFSISQPVSDYLPIKNIITEKTVEQMISQTSGLPGLFDYGSYIFEAVPDLDLNNLPKAIIQILRSINKLPEIISQTHLCQFFGYPAANHSAANPLFDSLLRILLSMLPQPPSAEFDGCGQQIISSTHDDIIPAGQEFRYGGSQWQVAGYTATKVTGKSWNQLFDEYIAQPCDLDITTYRNFWSHWAISGGTLDIPGFDRFSPDSIQGQDNPNIEGGLITSLNDYGKLLQVHLNDGYCDDQQVLTTDAIKDMRTDRGGLVPVNSTPYGMGWFIDQERSGLYRDPGMFGSLGFIDLSLGIGAYIVFDDYSSPSLIYRAPHNLSDYIQNKIIELAESAQNDI